LWLAGLATSTQTARDVPSCFRGRSALKHARKKRKSVSTQRERLKPPFVLGRSLRLKQRVSCAISMACGFKRVPCSPNETIFALFAESPARIPRNTRLFCVCQVPFAQPSRVAQIKPPTRGSDPKRASALETILEVKIFGTE